MFSWPAPKALLMQINNDKSDKNQDEKYYKALEREDYFEVFITALDFLKKTQQVPPLSMMTKSVDTSNEFRNMGNEACKNEDLKTAFILYNKALLYAPKNSKEMVLAYSNRSQVLQSQEAYVASLADIETCLTMDCKDIVEKLMRRKKKLVKLAQIEQFENDRLSMSAKYINTDITHNAEISCASTQIKVNRSDNLKLVAATPVNAGCVLAIEQPFVSYTIPENSLFSCHYCQKMTLNLIPCDGCCYVLFCDEMCRKTCIIEYHEYECKIMDILKKITDTSFNLMFKASLKIRAMSKSWQKLINDYNNKNTIQSATIKEIFDYKYQLSILQTIKEKPFVHGVLYNKSCACAAVIHYLQEMTFFFPKKSDEQEQAIRVFSKIMMFLVIHQTPKHIFQPATVLKAHMSSYYTNPNYGLYSFTDKIKTSCKPNIMAINNNHQVILIAIKTIKYEEELTILNDRFGVQVNRLKTNLTNFWISREICNCELCDEAIHSWSDKTDQLSKKQMSDLTNLNFGQIDHHMKRRNFSVVFPYILKSLDILSNVPYSPQYREIMKYFNACILHYEYVKTKNYLINPIGGM